VTLDLIVIALAIALEPLPLTAYILVLSAANGKWNGAGFLAGWLASLVGVVTLTLLVTGGEPLRPDTVPSQAALVIRLLLGAWLVRIAWSRHRTSGQRQHSAPRWMSMMDRLNFGYAALLAFLLQPWGLVAAGAATVTEADLSQAGSVAAMVGFCLLGTSTYLAMEVHVIVAPEASRARLKNLQTWIDTHRDQTIVALSLIVGFWLIAKSSYLLAT
jgi:threonine/homoserine/homoserine lactone efflux protein